MLQQSGDATRLLLKGLVMAAKRALDGPEGWFPRSKKSFLEVIEFRGGSASAVAPVSAADLDKVRAACRVVYDDMSKNAPPGQKVVAARLAPGEIVGPRQHVTAFVFAHDQQGRKQSQRAKYYSARRSTGSAEEQEAGRAARAAAASEHRAVVLLEAKALDAKARAEDERIQRAFEKVHAAHCVAAKGLYDARTLPEASTSSTVAFDDLDRDAMMPFLLEAKATAKAAKRVRAPPFNTPAIICAQSDIMQDRGEIDPAESVLVINPSVELTEQLEEAHLANLRRVVKENIALDDDDVLKKFKHISVVHGKPTAADARRTYDCGHAKADEIGFGDASSLLKKAVEPVAGVSIGKDLAGKALRIGVNPSPTQDVWDSRPEMRHYSIGQTCSDATAVNVTCHMDSRPAALSAPLGSMQQLHLPNKDRPSNSTGGTILLIDSKPGAQKQVAFQNLQDDSKEIHVASDARESRFQIVVFRRSLQALGWEHLGLSGRGETGEMRICVSACIEVDEINMSWKQWKELWETAYSESSEVKALSLPAFRRLTAADIPSLTKKWNRKYK